MGGERRRKGVVGQGPGNLGVGQRCLDSLSRTNAGVVVGLVAASFSFSMMLSAAERNETERCTEEKVLFLLSNGATAGN